MGVIYLFHSPHYVFVWPCLLWPNSVSGSIPLPIHYPPASMGYRHHPSALCTCSFQGLQPNHFTCGLHPSSVDVPVDIHSPSHNFPFFHLREALLVGHWVTALPSCSCGVLLSSPSMEVVLHGVGAGTPVLYMKVAHTQGNANLWHNKKKLVLVEDSWPSMLVHHFVGRYISCDLLYHLPSLFIPPILNLPLSLPGIHLH